MSEQYFIDKIKRRCAKIKEHCATVQEYVSGVSRDDFVNNDMRLQATSWQIWRMGDIMLKLNANFRKANLQIPWGKAIRLRNKIKHAFSHIDGHDLWRFAKHELPVIIAGLDNLVLDYDLIADTTDNVLTLEEIKRLGIPIFKRSGVSKAVLYGSYAKGEATDHSDVDLLVESEKEKFYAVEVGDALGLALGKHVDCFDARRVTTVFQIADGVVLYENR